MNQRRNKDNNNDFNSSCASEDSSVMNLNRPPL